MEVGGWGLGVGVGIGGQVEMQVVEKIGEKQKFR